MAKKDKLMEEIKKMEAAAREQAAAQAAPATKGPNAISFDMWHMQRAKEIPAHHMKEIIWADFKGRGLSNKESAEVYDEALAKYGVKLK